MKFITVLSATLISLTVALPACGTPQATKSQANRPPVIEQIGGPTDWSPASDGQFTVTASDPDGDKLTYSWLVDNNTIEGNGIAASWTSPATMGKHMVTVVVNDGRGGETRGSREIKIIVNADGTQTLDAPVVLKMSFPSPEVVTGSKRVRIWSASPAECIVTGADPKDLKFAWTASNGRIQGKGLNEGTATTVTWIAPGVGGDFTLDVVVTDISGNQSKGTIKFTVYCCGNY